MNTTKFLSSKSSLLILLLCIMQLSAFSQNEHKRLATACSLPVPVITSTDSLAFCKGDSVILTATDSGISAKTLDQSQLIYTGGTSARTLAGYSEWQSFTAGMTGNMSEIDMGFFNAINGSGTLNVFGGQGTAGTLLQSLSVNVVCVSGNCLIPFAVNVAVTSGQVYTFQFIPGPGIPDPYGVQVSMSNTYSGGEMGLVDPSGTSYPGFDLVFETYVMAPVTLSYHWSGGTVGASKVAYSTGTYTVTVSDTAGCTASASVNVTAYSPPSVYLTHDTSVHRGSSISPICIGTMHYLWSNGDTTSAIVIDSAARVIVTVTDIHGCSVMDTATVHILTTGIAETGYSQPQIMVYPNPIADHIVVDISDRAVFYTVRLFDMLGRNVFIKEMNAGYTEIGTSGLDKGDYVLEVSMGDKSYRYVLSKL